MVATDARRLATPTSVNAAIKQIADVMRRAHYAGALLYVPELSWILFLRILDEREELEGEEAEAVGVPFTPSLEPPYRWRDWADPAGAQRVALRGARWARTSPS
jgi:type I restriction enzyme M protein